ncbi:hypothetical protein RO3G_15394 [Rhizopus delemar RA 99-880]|uniref:Uncharacterized protein n=1 Tax=Rhizopus delemar (strain RA 99-880 / ATCC MYA-4621 / FGSC 9543 / NRRL 43880) TaxID=246409 RepID=I1CQF3_RHIO9|nr:hypothetical protein RO3G_15394 [Rhizopus delemar RA 99-880]|eukprot:EIE90683.1 hypothetical protein RO3G_15394 [Rhizopus delemar RA 99-880]
MSFNHPICFHFRNYKTIKFGKLSLLFLYNQPYPSVFIVFNTLLADFISVSCGYQRLTDCK